jgi:hypothetical protein
MRLECFPRIAMTSRQRLIRYDDEQARLVLSRSQEAVRRGHLVGVADLYPDFSLGNDVAYTRAPIPLGFLVFLYETIVVFVPPASKAELEARWQLPMDVAVDLIRAKIIQPIIGQATEYGADHFGPILEMNPPSLFVRGKALLDELGMGHTLDERFCPLPVKDMARLPAVVDKYRKYFPEYQGDELDKRVRREILTNYADLWIFGEGHFADTLAKLGDPTRIMSSLLLANEVRTYPMLFGMGGTANYDRHLLMDERGLYSDVGTQALRVSDRAALVPDSLPLMLGGIGIDIRNFNAQEVIDFHISNDGRLLRRAVRSFEDEAKQYTIGASRSSVEEVWDRAAQLQRAITDAARELQSPGFIRKARDTETRTQMVLRVGTPAIGGLLGHLITSSAVDAVGFALGAAALDQYLFAPLRARVTNLVLSARFHPGLANLWQLRRRIDP